ncbi:MAG: hypothetical protein JNM40_05025 [Myxococcales bacterium]|nr:hypothetical protein [Myxococcales bacterium]
MRSSLSSSIPSAGLFPFILLSLRCGVDPWCRSGVTFRRGIQVTQQEQSAQTLHAEGRWVGVGCVVLTGSVLAVTVRPSLPLGLLLGLLTLSQALFAYRVGSTVGPLIAQRTWWWAPLLGALAGLILLGSTALAAMGIGLCWGLLEGIHGSDWAYSYLGKPPLAVLVYGSLIALPLGTVGGLLIRLLTWLRSRLSAAQ